MRLGSRVLLRRAEERKGWVEEQRVLRKYLGGLCRPGKRKESVQ